MSSRETIFTCWISLLFALAVPSVSARPMVSLGRDNTAVVSTSRYLARVIGGSVVYLKDRTTGETLLDGSWTSPMVRFVERGAPVTVTAPGPRNFCEQLVGKDAVRFVGRIAHGRCAVTVVIEIKAKEEELVMTGRAEASGSFEGLASISLSLGSTLPHTEVIVPTTGGNSYRSTGLRAAQTLEWPITWEAAMLQVQGRHGGVLICAYEPFKRFKNLHLSPARTGWNIALESENHAPFQGKRAVESLVWHVRPYNGKWRQGASIYRNWHRRTFRSCLGEDPAWVRDIRAEIHCGTDPGVLDALVKAGIDPRQTLLYVADWRSNPYDLNYPDYTPADHLAPFIEKAHRLGFRVMLHVNYFGCDPKMAEYERFKRFQIKHRYSGELQWWDWPRSEPPRKFAYINPASREWRRFFVAKMVELVRRTGADALHLDQTLCIFNDGNGPIDGLNMAEGNLSLHRELKAAMPELVLSGEGLNEVTTIYEAFAQRLVAGIDGVNQSFNRAAINQSHPICAYLFGGRTKPYDHLGSGSPDKDQFRLAWRDAHRHWGVLPGFGWPSVKSLENPSPSARQALEEIIAHQKHRLDAWTEGLWPEHVDFPYRSASGEWFANVSLADGWALCRTDAHFKPIEQIVRVVTGVRSVRLPGTIPGAFCYDRDTICCLDPARYYVYFPEPRKSDAFHIECSNHSAVVESACAGESVSFVLLAASRVLFESSELLEQAEAFYVSPSGVRRPLTLELAERTGVTVQPRGSGLFMHPQWKGDGIGLGAAQVAFCVDVPRALNPEFAAECRLDTAAEGKSDGVLFRTTAVCGDESVETEVTADSSAPVGLVLPLERFVGKRVEIRVTAHAGPKHDPTFDWGILENPRLLVRQSDVRCRVIPPAKARYMVAPVFRRLWATEAQEVMIPAGGAAMVTSLEPESVSATTKLGSIPHVNCVCVTGLGSGDAVEEQSIALAPAVCGGVERQALFSHPPDRGARLLHYFVQLPDRADVSLVTAVGLKDGSKSDGVRFAVWLNGKELWSRRVVPSEGWVPVSVSLGRLTGAPIILTLVADSNGTNYCDWALWADPELVVRDP